MSWIAVAVVGSSIIGGAMSADAQSSAAETAANAQTQAAQMGVDERRRQFDSLQNLLNPFVQAATGVPALASTGGAAGGVHETADQIRARLAPQFTTPGTAPLGMLGIPKLGPNGEPLPSGPSQVNEQALNAAVQAELAKQQQATATMGAPGTGYMAPGGGGSLRAQQDIIGLNGAAPQQAAIDRLQTMPAFTSALKLGENRILQNASATGGMRGGNTQGALAYFAPQLLAQQINDYYGRLSGITSLGQNAAAMVGNAGMQTGAGIADLFGQAGSAQAGAALAGGRAQSNLYSSMSGALGQYLGMGGSFGGGISPDAIQGAFAQTPAGSSGFGTGLAYGNQDMGLFL